MPDLSDHSDELRDALQRQSDRLREHQTGEADRLAAPRLRREIDALRRELFDVREVAAFMHSVIASREEWSEQDEHGYVTAMRGKEL